MHNQFKTQKFKHLMLAMGPRDLKFAPCSPVHCSSHSMTSSQSSELTELPVVENSQLFAQRAHSARYAPKGSKGGVQHELVPGQEEGLKRSGVGPALACAPAAPALTRLHCHPSVLLPPLPESGQRLPGGIRLIA